MSSKIQGIVVEIGGDTTKLGKALEQVNRTSKALQTELKGVNSLLKYDPSNTNLLVQKQELLAQSIEKAKEKLKKLKDVQGQVEKSFEDGKIGVEEYRDFQREVASTEQKLKSLNKEMESFGSVSAQKIAVAGEKVKNVGDNLQNVGKKALGVTAGVTAMGAGIVKVGSEFDSSMKQVAATMGITAEQIENGDKSYKILEEAAKKCGETTKYSASEAADALNYLALAGYDAEKSAEVLPKVLNLAAAGNLDLATASDMVTDAMAALGLETKDLDLYIDEMAKTSQKSNTSVSQLGEATLTVAGTAKMANMSLETMNTELGILANNGIKGAEGGTHLRNIILSLTSPTDEASKALSNLGINVLDSQGNVRDLNDIMKDFNSELDGLSDGEKTEIISTIFNKTDISAVNALIKGSGEEFSNLKNELFNCDGAAQNMADTMNSSFSGQLTLLKSQIEGIAIQLSQTLIPIIKSILDKISSLLTWFSSLSSGTQKVILIIAGLAAAFGPVIIGIGKVVSSIGTIMTTVPKIVSTIKTVKIAMAGLNTTFLASPITWIIAAIVGLIAIFVTLWNKCEWFRNFWIGLWDNIKNIVSNAINGIKNFFIGIIDFFKNNWQTILLFIANPFAGAFKLLYDKCDGFRNFIDNFINGIKQFFINLGIWFANIGNWIYQNVILPIYNIFTGVCTWINDNVIQPIWLIISTVVGKIVEIISKIWEIIVAVFSVACTWVNDNVIQPIVEIVTGFIESIIIFFSNLWEAIVNIFAGIGEWFSTKFNETKELIIEVFTPIIEWFIGVYESIKQIFEFVGQWFSEKFTEAYTCIKNVFSNIGSWFSDRWNDIKSIFSVVGTWFKDRFSEAWSNIKNVFSGVGNFFGGLWNTIKDKFSSLGTSIGDAIGNSVKSGINGVISIIENTINRAVGLINGAIDLVNNIPGVSVGKIEPIQLPRLAKGSVLKKPTVFLGGEYPGADKNPEIVSPLSMIKKGVSDVLNSFMYKMQTTTVDNALNDKIYGLLERYLPGIYDRSDKDIYVDGDALIGSTISKIDERLGNLKNKRGRGQ